MLLGVMVGTATCFVLVGQPVLDLAVTAAPLASVTVFIMLMSSLHGAPRRSHVRH